MKRLSFSIESFGSFANEHALIKCARAHPGLFCLVSVFGQCHTALSLHSGLELGNVRFPSFVLCPPESFEIPYTIGMAFSIYAKEKNIGILTEMASNLLIGCYTRPVLILLACDSIYMSFQIIFINIL